MAKPKDIQSAILSSLCNLERNKARTLNEIAKEIESHSKTTKENLEQIQLIQEHESQIEIIKTKSQTFVKLKEEKDYISVIRLLNYIIKLLTKKGKK